MWARRDIRPTLALLKLATLASTTAMDASLLIGMVSACTALVASIGGAVIALKVARRQFNATVISGNRHKWVEALRDELAELISLLATALGDL